jgi:hypothetical protein
MEALTMHRLIGTVLICIALVFVAMGSNSAFAQQAPDRWGTPTTSTTQKPAETQAAAVSTSPQKYGIEVRGGFGQYDMGDVTPGIQQMATNLWDKGIIGVTETKDVGPAAGFSLLFRPTRHAMWEVGYNALMDVENKVTTIPDTASGQILMHASEFFVKGNLVATLTDRVNLNFGAGISYNVAELQIQDNLKGEYFYDADGRAFGLVGSLGIEFLVTNRIGLNLQGGGRLANTTWFSYIDKTTGNRATLSAIGGGRPMEVNLSGAYANLGLRFYFDPVTKPVDFSR